MRLTSGSAVICMSKNKSWDAELIVSFSHMIHVNGASMEPSYALLY